MNRTMIAALAAASIFGLAACSQQAPAPPAGDPINGTWKADIASVQIDQKPDVYLLKDGQYSCPSCTPPIAVAADGAFHAVPGAAYFDSYSVKAVDDKTISRSSRKGDKVVGESTLQVSADGNTLNGSFKDMSTPNAPPVTGKYTETRVAAAPAGAHAASGSWKPAKIENVSDEGLTLSFKHDGDSFSMNSPAGQSYTAKLDGKDVPITGDSAGTTASVERLSDTSYRETDKRAGKVVGVATFTVAADGKLNVVAEDKERGSTTRYTAIKQ